jgi:beta-xylosidase
MKRCVYFAIMAVLLIACGASTSEDDGSDESELAAPSEYTNPIIPMFERPAGVPSDIPKDAPHQASEGCPDPSVLRTHGGELYIYCTSYTFRFGRHDGFPIFKSRSRSLAGPWKRVGSLIPDGGSARSTWPRWVKDDGDFWGPDVHELADGKFVAGYSAPCGASRCVGIAWASQPEGPWTHADQPFISPGNNGVGSEASYDPSLLITSNGELYLYWVVVNHGVLGARVHAKSSGELVPVHASDVRMIADRARGQRGEGPYVIEHGGAFYEFYSTGSLEYSYHVGVRRGLSPLARFDQEDTEVVLAQNARFVATGGNSVLQNAIDGTDFLVYHAIEVPRDGGCPRLDPEYGRPVKEVPAGQGDANPYCRVQGERQAMVDPIEWKRGPDGIEWPRLKNASGTPSIGKTKFP